jgi:hypothetical protein
MNKIKIGFFSFTEITDPTQHHSYNEWHMLDHMPEQFPLVGVQYGQRWVSTPACRKARAASDPLLDPAHYLTLYLMTEPVERTLKDFYDWGAQLSALGRFHRHRRGLLSGPFAFLKAYAAPRVRVSPESIPYRPNRGIFVVVQEPQDPARFDAYVEWLDLVHYPDMLSVDGVAGLWSFAAAEALGGYERAPHARRITVYYLDQPPLQVAAELGRRSAQWRAAGRMPDFSQTMKLLFAGPFETITPWQWDWFDKEA